MSRNAVRDYSVLRKPLSIRNNREWRAVFVDLPLRYACCASESRLGLIVSLICANMPISLKELIAHLMRSGFEMLSMF